MTQDQISAKMELQRVLEQMNEDITAKPKEAIDAFEAEQEENAIISYQELVNNVKNEKSIKIDLKDVYEDEYLEEEIKPSIEKETIIILRQRKYLMNLKIFQVLALVFLIIFTFFISDFRNKKGMQPMVNKKLVSLIKYFYVI